MSYIPGQPSHWATDMTDTITVYATSTVDNYGKVSTSGTSATFSARIMADVSRTRDNEGVQIVEGGTLYIMSDAAITIGSRLVLPGGREPIVLSVDKVTYPTTGTSSAVHHTVVKFGRA
jgi:hypothetical protein